MKNLLLALAISLGIVACADPVGDEGVSNVDGGDAGGDSSDIGLPDIQDEDGSDVDPVDDTDVAADSDSEGSDAAPDVDEDIVPTCDSDEPVVCENTDGNECPVCSDDSGQIRFETDWIFDADGNHVIDFRINDVVVSTICNESVGELRSGVYRHESVPSSNSSATCTITGAIPSMGYTITFIVAE